MQIVIDISSETYEIAQKDQWKWPADDVYKAIKNGTVLPEHGRLIDADKLLKHFERGQMRWGEDVAFVINQETPTVLEGTK